MKDIYNFGHGHAIQSHGSDGILISGGLKSEKSVKIYKEDFDLRKDAYTFI